MSTKASDAIVSLRLPRSESPASTTVQVIAVFLPEAMIELDAVAFIPASSRSPCGNPSAEPESGGVVIAWVIDPFGRHARPAKV
jgi:hypothetical protein